jgi:triacylglycerol esterase/lipase EstA (alpha/beta hydrolase family)
LLFEIQERGEIKVQPIRRQIAALFLVLTTVLGVNVMMPTAIGVETTACASELGITDLPTPADAAVKTPVILVHGLWSKGNAWKNTGMSLALSKLGEAAVVTPFNYGEGSPSGDKSNRWVTDGDTAQRLAKTIVCYSRLYGDKDVVIVAHSMGGLLTRAALDWAAYGTFARNVTGHVITIGTPHEGALLANGVDEFWVTLCRRLRVCLH